MVRRKLRTLSGVESHTSQRVCWRVRGVARVLESANHSIPAEASAKAPWMSTTVGLPFMAVSSLRDEAGDEIQ